MARRFHPHDEIDNDLRHINDVLKTEAYDHRIFVPKLALRGYLTSERVRRLLVISCTHSLHWEEVCNKYLAVFVILLTIQEGPYIVNFLQHNYLADAHLPFNDQSIWPGEYRKFFKAFDEVQWEYCAQSLGPNDLHDKLLDPRIVVPIISQHLLKSGDSRTSRIEVHPDYNHLLPALRRDANVASPRFLVLKTSTLLHENLHRNEVRAYTILRRHNDIQDNIARFHGSWRQGDTYNILLEYVEGGTLENLFVSNRATSWDMLSFWTRLLDILKPLCRIHCQADQGSYDRVDYGAHQDIKPQNILVARGLSTHTFDGTFKLVDLGLTYLPPTEANECQERRGRDVPGTQMYSAPECFRPESKLFISRTVQPVDCKKDVWSLACVLSEAVVWCVLGTAGLDDYRAKRRAETAKLPELQRTAYNGCFHDGESVLPAMEEFHDKVRRSRGTYDQIINDILPIIEEMFEHVDQRPDAMSAHKKFNAAIATAQRLSYPPVFRVSPELPQSPQFSPANPGAATGLGLKSPPNRKSHVVNGPRSLIETNPISPPSTSKLSNGFRDQPIDTVVLDDSASFAPKPCIRSFTDQPIRTQSITSPALQPAGGSGRSASGAGFQNTVHFENRRLPDHSAMSSDDRILRTFGDPSLSVAEEHRRVLTKKYATITQVSQWLSDKSPGPPKCPVSEDELACLYGTDQIFIVDNSASMLPYRQQVVKAFAALSYLVKRLDRDGMDLHFTTSHVTDHAYHRASMITKLSKVDYRGETHMDITLGKVLESSNSKRRSVSALFRREGNWAKSIYILTDGKWHGKDYSLCGIPELVHRFTQQMGSRGKLGIQFVQFGSDEVGTWRLKELDDGLKKLGMMDIIDTEPYDGNVYKMLLGNRSDTWD